jgi:hypothetical protein
MTFTELTIGRNGRGDRLRGLMISPRRDTLRFLSLLVHPEGQKGYLDSNGMPVGLAKLLLEREQSILLVDTFLTGEAADSALAKKRRPFEHYFTTYNRTDLQERVQDIVTLAAFAKAHGKGRRVILCGQGRAGLWALAAAPMVDAVVADCANLDLNSDAVLLEADLLIPGFRRLGAFPGAASLAVPNPQFLHNVGQQFDTEPLQKVYRLASAPGALRVEPKPMAQEAIADWITEQTQRR